MDSRLTPYGANDFNIASIRNKVKLDEGDIRKEKDVARNIADKDIIFNLAAQVDHNLSLKKPHLDIEINCWGHINVLEECRKNNPTCKLVFPGSRMEYGKVTKLPVKENTPLNPLSIYAVNKLAVEKYYMAYHNHHKLDTTAVRIANPFGPRAQVKHPGYCIVNWFIRKALENEKITLFGDGGQLRDYIFVDDLVEALSIAGVHKNSSGKGILINCLGRIILTKDFIH